jgi:ureidoglycolate lyase
MTAAAIYLNVEPLSAQAFEPYGEVIEVSEAGRHFSINQGFAVRHHDLARVDVASAGGHPLLSIFRAQPRLFPLQLLLLERHPLGSQAFMPLSPQPYLVVVAVAAAVPAPASVRCFLAQPGQGVNYAKGVWHHPLIALQTQSDFLVIDRGGAAGDANCDEWPLAPTPIWVCAPLPA